ncbi:MAG: hypothetical protein Q9159_007634 [Coniocarpon cinnabarinum]
MAQHQAAQKNDYGNISNSALGFFGTKDSTIKINTAPTGEKDIDRLCLRALQCPSSRDVKEQLKISKDTFLVDCTEWFTKDSQYIKWRDSENIRLLWVKRVAGKGKTMLSINLIDELLDTSGDTSVVAYFLCQNADRDLNTLEAMVKGLIRCLIDQRGELKEHLRRRWDPINSCFEPDLASWKELWAVFTAMLEDCRCQRIYVIVDALDECQRQDMAKFPRTLIRTQTTRPHSKVKWILTSRPLDSADTELLPAPELTHLDLELNSVHVARAVTIYISRKMTELEHRRKYGKMLRECIEAELKKRAEDTFLWVMMLAYRPLDTAEAASMMDSTDKAMDLDASARDYLAGDEGRSRLVRFKAYEHGGIGLRCLSVLSEQLNFNIAGSTRWDADIQSAAPLVTCARSAGLDYAATSWTYHLKDEDNTTVVRNVLEDDKEQCS